MNHRLYIAPRNALALGNDRWEDDRVSDIDFETQVSGTSLDPGEELTALEIVSNERDVEIAIHALGTTAHPADLSGDGSVENIVRYRVEARPDDPTDQYNVLPGMSTTAPFGEIGDPQTLYPAGAVGPMYSFRVIIENRSNTFANPESVNVDEIGVTAQAEAVRNRNNGGV